MDMVGLNAWTNPREGSEKVPNSGKKYFLGLAADMVRTVSAQRDSDWILYTRKALIRCGMAMNINGLWEIRQLSPELQEIVGKYKNNFDGVKVASEGGLDGKAAVSEDES